jgi:hypothetical protein
MTTQEPISPELQAKIDSLPDAKLRNDILFLLRGPGKRTATNEQIFNDRVANHEEAAAQRAQWREWRDDEALAFIEYFKQEAPEDFAEYIEQERDRNEIDADLSWRVARLADRWIPGLTYADNGNLLNKVRDHLQHQLHESGKKNP